MYVYGNTLVEFAAYFSTRSVRALFSLNIFIALVKHGVGPQVFPTLVTALPLPVYIQNVEKRHIITLRKLHQEYDKR